MASQSATSNMGLGSCVSYDLLGGSSSSCSGVGQQGMGGFFPVSSPQMGFPEIIDHTSPAAPSVLFPPFDPNLSFQTGN